MKKINFKLFPDKKFAIEIMVGMFYKNRNQLFPIHSFTEFNRRN